jgi:RNA polymerase sigma factor (sigma-70 family)
VNVDWPALQADVVAAAAGDEAAQARVVERCYEPVRQLVHRDLQADFRARHRWMLPLFSTHDVVHEVLMAVVADLADTQFDGAGRFCAYLATLVRHRLLDAVRFHEAARRDVRRDEGPATGALGGVGDARGVTPTFAASLAERAVLVRSALDELPERQRRLLELRLLEEQTFAQIRDALGYGSDESARLAFHDAQARLLVKLRTRGFGRTNGA